MEVKLACDVTFVNTVMIHAMCFGRLCAYSADRLWTIMQVSVIRQTGGSCCSWQA